MKFNLTRRGCSLARRIRGLVLLATLDIALAAPPLRQAHSHNDYENDRPLEEALDHGFCSVEADIYLVRGKLLVAHHPLQLREDRTLERLYLAPLAKHVGANNGSVHPDLNPGNFTLLIDIKKDAEKVYPVLREQLKKYAKILTSFSPDKTTPGAVTVILSGDRPTNILAAEPQRWCAIDGRLGDLKRDPSPEIFPLISDDWKSVFPGSKGKPLDKEQRIRLRKITAQAHQQGRKIRFWGVPDNASFWEELRAAEVDLIGTDNIPELSKFLTPKENP